MHTIQVDVNFSAGHRVLGHSGKCRHLHGHSYTARVVIEAESLTDLGFVLDFKTVKDFVKMWIDENWDHNMILNKNDPLDKCYNNPVLLYHTTPLKCHASEVLGDRQPYIMPHGRNPTAEAMAQALYTEVDEWLMNRRLSFCDSADRKVRVDWVAIKEEEGSWATYYGSE